MSRLFLSFCTLASAAVMCLTSCSPKLCPVASSDSVRVEYRERVIRDTAYVVIPREVERIVTRDTSSTLANTYATSTAAVTDGELHHSLETIPQTIAAPVLIVVHDTTVIASKADTVVEYRDRELTWWQRVKMEFGGIFLGLLGTAVVVLLVRILRRQ